MHERKPPRPRNPRIGFSGVPRDWLARSQAASHVANGVNLLFPAGERFFVRSVYHYLDRIKDDAVLLAEVKGFAGQEGRHAQAHERFFEAMRVQGYDIDSILGPYERVAYDIIEKRSPARLRLAVTVAAEHFTAIMAEQALTSGEFEHADPALRALLYWHAVEELEHKAVAFDVLRAVHPSYALRVAGMAVGATLLGVFWLGATRALLAQDGMTLLDARREMRALAARARKSGEKPPDSIVRGVFLRGIAEYLRPGFHPHDRDHTALVAATLARLAAEDVVDPERGVEEAAE